MSSEPLVAPELLGLLQCPVCHGTLSERPDPPALVCQSCGRGYPVRNGVPVMLVEEAEPPADQARS